MSGPRRDGVDGHVPGAGPWLVFMRWEDLLFLHWRVPIEALRPLVPGAFEIETFDGSAWLGVVPFRMAHVHPRFLPPVGIVSDFAEINVRTYVRFGGRPGVWFLSLDADDRLACALGRNAFRLPYRRAVMSAEEGSDGWIDYRSDRVGRVAAGFRGRFRPRSDGPAPADELTDWLTVRDGLWTVDRQGRPLWAGIRHPAWLLQAAEAEISDISLVAADGVSVEGPPVHMAFSRALDVVGWRPVRLG